jgi:Signal transduction histidine kinase involved in nitrogen fixation and metabolism regulation
LSSNHTRRFFSRKVYLLVTAAWLFTASFFIDNYWSGTATPSAVKSALERDIVKKQQRFEALCRDSVLVNKLITKKYKADELQDLVNKKSFIFIYQLADSTPSLIFWNTQVVQPDSVVISSTSPLHLVKLQNGWYVAQQRSWSNKQPYKIIMLIPVKWEYYISNKYLGSSFAAIKDIENDYDINPVRDKIAITGKDGPPLFYLKKLHVAIVPHNNVISIWFRIIGSILILLFINMTAGYIVARRGVWQGFLMLMAMVVFLRGLSYFFPFPLFFRQFTLFDPAIYGSNFVLRSLGDLFINALLIVWLILFLRYHLQERIYVPKTVTSWKRYTNVGIIAVIMILVTFVSGHTIRSLVADSQISFDVLNYFSINNAYSIIGFIVLCCIAVAYFFLFQILLYLLGLNIDTRSLNWYGILIFSGLFLMSLKISSPYVAFDLMMLLWLMLFVYLMNNEYLKLLTYQIISSRFIFWLFFFSLSITAIIVLQNNKKEINNRKHFAENIYNKADPIGERIMNIGLTDFREDILSEIFPRFLNPVDNRHLKDSLTNEIFSGYLNKYETRIYTFNSREKPLYNEDSTIFSTLNTIIETQGKPTSTAGLYYYDVSYGQFNYISKKTITDSSREVMGYVFIISNPKKYKNDALYPELFSKGNVNSIESSPLYAFAVYDNNRLINSYNDYPFPTALSPDQLRSQEYWSIRNDDYDELWYRPNDEKVVIIAKQESFYIESITLFAYLFCSFLLMAALFRLMNLLIKNKFNLGRIKLFSTLSIRSQVHLTIISISIFSFVIIGVTTILFFISRYHNNNREKLSRTIHIIENEVRLTLDKYSMYNFQQQSYDIVSNANLEQAINKIAEGHAADINLYDLTGNLRVSSLPLPYNKGIVSKKMDPVAFYHVNNLKDVQFFLEQKIGSLSYLNDYVPVRDQFGKQFAYLNIPYFESQNNLQEEISNFLVTIINLNAFIFLIAGIIAVFITNRVTRSFSVISDKMKEVNLGKVNEFITWNRKDEIGELVDEYNKMVKKLDSSAEMLAKSEREGAWREMARQVAHEIKNPLTPMKLNLQYLQMAIDSRLPNVQEISLYVSKVLVEQIDHLSQIASDFAQFADIGQSKNQLFNLNESLKHVTSLYSTNDMLNIKLKGVRKAIIVDADKTQINRVFTNLLQNAIQAVPEERKTEIEIETILQDHHVIVSVKDNGNGIPDDMRERIFTPNFTTKTSGTGLGLAMCKGIVEKLNGKIWFDSVEGQHTTFFVELPVVTS